VPFQLFRTIDIGSVAAGATGEQSWTSDGDYTIHRIYLVEKTGASINAVEVTIRLDGTLLSRDYVPAAILGVAHVNNPVIDVSIKNGQKITFGVKNNESAARALYVVLELWA
jgi:hypothetical protein